MLLNSVNKLCAMLFEILKIAHAHLRMQIYAVQSSDPSTLHLTLYVHQYTTLIHMLTLKQCGGGIVDMRCVTSDGRGK